MTEQHYDVVVGGAGIVGAALALSLARLNGEQALRVALVEPRQAEPRLASVSDGDVAFDSRVVALNESSRQLLIKLGVWDQIVTTRACAYTRMQVRDSEGTGFIGFDSADIQQDNLGHIVENWLVLDALREAIDEQTNIDLLCPEQINALSRTEHTESSKDTRLVLGLENKTISTTLLVAADGAQSKLRDICGFKTRQWDYGHQAIVATLRGESSHQYVAMQWFTQDGPLAFLPLQSKAGDSHYVSIVWSQSHERSDELMAMSEQGFCRELSRASEAYMGNLELVSARQSFPLRQCHAIDYVQARVALIGDAAHAIHPLAGQGVNLGLSDVRVLNEELAKCANKDLDIGTHEILQRYQRRRKPENLAVMAAMEGFKRLFEREELPLRFLRNLGMNRLDALAPLKNRLIKQAMGLGSSVF
ncbi:MAG: UbiH/UbiF/VisC/COQ6 family ubiquinone biosynthesis hydroxylase [Porticoccaceae bacterium]|nr:UbiH/UbiF/VisC/COQ6 family ubiquinone biosynthesis hydroxylase [Porticoccaceae bacterium]